MNESSIDPALLSIIDKRFVAITREMGYSMTRTTSSPFFNAGDMCASINDPNGDILCQAEYLPLMSFSSVPATKSVIEFFADDIHDGDMFIHNDPFYGGNQLQDVGILKPIFHDGKVQFWSVAKGHQTDIGGPVFGGYNAKATEVFQETIRIPPLRFYDKGELRKDVWNFILENSRVPAVLARDLQSQIGACVVGERRVKEMIKEYGLAKLWVHLNALFDATDKRMADEISKMKEGVYHSSASLRHEGISNKEYTARLTVEIRNSKIKFDFTGTDQQSPGFINGVYSTSYSSAFSVFFQCVDPEMPHNQGAARRVEMIIPEGTLLNARKPAATVRGNFTCSWLIGECMMEALSKVIPENVTASWWRNLNSSVTGLDPETGRVNHDVLFTIGALGGAGAAYGLDGYPQYGQIAAHGHICQDYEIYEMRNPHLLLETGYWTDSGGPGRWRGGLGVILKVKLLEKTPIRLVTRGDNMYEPFGLFGGLRGKRNSLLIHAPNGETVDADPNSIIEVESGTVLEAFMGGGGGYGDPKKRASKTVEDEMIDGIISEESARKDYGLESIKVHSK